MWRYYSGDSYAILNFNLMARQPDMHQPRRWFVRSWGTYPMVRKEIIRDDLAVPAWHATHLPIRLRLPDYIYSHQPRVAGIFLVSFGCCLPSHSVSKPVLQNFHCESLHYHLGSLPQFHCPLRPCARATGPIFCCYGKSSPTTVSCSRVGSIDTRWLHLFGWCVYQK